MKPQEIINELISLEADAIERHKNDVERWEAIKGYEGLYEISDLGKVKSLHRRGRLLKHGYTGIKYRCVVLCKDGETKTFKIHRLVATYYVPNPDNKPEVNHLFANKENNAYWAVEWATGRENMDHAIKYDLLSPVSGSQNGKSKKIIDIGSGKVYDSVTSAAEDNSMSRQSLSNFLNRSKINPTSLTYLS